MTIATGRRPRAAASAATPERAVAAEDGVDHLQVHARRRSTSGAAAPSGPASSGSRSAMGSFTWPQCG